MCVRGLELSRAGIVAVAAEKVDGRVGETEGDVV